jgi:hypothetical protein
LDSHGETSGGGGGIICSGLEVGSAKGKRADWLVEQAGAFLEFGVVAVEEGESLLKAVRLGWCEGGRDGVA